MNLDEYYKSEHDPHLLEDGFLPEAHQDYYVGINGKLKPVSKTIYDAKLEIEKGKMTRIREELARHIKVLDKK